jgi:hypothetical protein
VFKELVEPVNEAVGKHFTSYETIKFMSYLLLLAMKVRLKEGTHFMHDLSVVLGDC